MVALMVLVLLGLTIFIRIFSLRKKKRNLRRIGEKEEDKEPKNKDEEQSYSLVEER